MKQSKCLPLKSNKLKELKKIGFIKVGHWQLKNDTIDFCFDIKNKLKKTEVLYAFVSNNKIKYIGKTKRKISKRLYNYKKPQISQKTNTRLNKNIKELLEQGIGVQIYLFSNSNEHCYQNVIKMNLASALEENLINKFNPEWNKQNKKK